MFVLEDTNRVLRFKYWSSKFNTQKVQFNQNSKNNRTLQIPSHNVRSSIYTFTMYHPNSLQNCFDPRKSPLSFFSLQKGYGFVFIRVNALIIFFSFQFQNKPNTHSNTNMHFYISNFPSIHLTTTHYHIFHPSSWPTTHYNIPTLQ